MRMIVRPYNNDGPRLSAIVAGGTKLAGVMIDAHITKFVPKVTLEAHQTIGPEAEFFIDPVTHKIDRPFFRGKESSFQLLPYYFLYPWGIPGPTVQELGERAQGGAEMILEHQQYFDVSSLVAPYFFVDTKECTLKSGSRFAAMQRWARAFAGLKADRPMVFTLCVAADCMVHPKSLMALVQFVQDHRPRTVYLQIYDWEIDGSEAITKGVLTFLERLRELGVERIIYSHAPAWIYFLSTRGITDFVSGINYLTTLKREFLEREEDIESSIPHNYYIPMRFCRMTPAVARDAIERQLIWPCHCPACKGAVPTAQNLIKEHYVHARARECEVLHMASRPVDLLQTWAEQAEEFLIKARENDLKVMGEPNPSRWKAILPSAGC